MDDAGSWLKQAEYSTYFNPEGFDAAKRVVRMPHKWGQWQERVAYVHQSIYPSIHPSTHPCTIISISPIKIEQVSYHSFRFGFYVYIYIYVYLHLIYTYMSTILLTSILLGVHRFSPGFAFGTSGSAWNARAACRSFAAPWQRSRSPRPTGSRCSVQRGATGCNGDMPWGENLEVYSG